MNKYNVILNNKECAVTLTNVSYDQVSFILGENSYTVSIQPEKTNTTSAVPTSDTKAISHLEGNELKAPMPGIIFKCLVSAGQKVSRGEILLIIEAMKMENNITASKDGVVEKVLVKQGQEVEAGQVLLSYKD
jgi:biotin carboxyl carrier protein